MNSCTMIYGLLLPLAFINLSISLVAIMAPIDQFGADNKHKYKAYMKILGYVAITIGMSLTIICRYLNLLAHETFLIIFIAGLLGLGIKMTLDPRLD